jgi:hypothetical protein
MYVLNGKSLVEGAINTQAVDRQIECENTRLAMARQAAILGGPPPTAATPTPSAAPPAAASPSPTPTNNGRPPNAAQAPRGTTNNSPAPAPNGNQDEVPAQAAPNNANNLGPKNIKELFEVFYGIGKTKGAISEFEESIKKIDSKLNGQINSLMKDMVKQQSKNAKTVAPNAPTPQATQVTVNPKAGQAAANPNPSVKPAQAATQGGAKPTFEDLMKKDPNALRAIIKMHILKHDGVSKYSGFNLMKALYVSLKSNPTNGQPAQGNAQAASANHVNGQAALANGQVAPVVAQTVVANPANQAAQAPAVVPAAPASGQVNGQAAAHGGNTKKGGKAGPQGNPATPNPAVANPAPSPTVANPAAANPVPNPTVANPAATNPAATNPAPNPAALGPQGVAQASPNAVGRLVDPFTTINNTLVTLTIMETSAAESKAEELRKDTPPEAGIQEGNVAQANAEDNEMAEFENGQAPNGQANGQANGQGNGKGKAKPNGQAATGAVNGQAATGAVNGQAAQAAVNGQGKKGKPPAPKNGQVQQATPGGGIGDVMSMLLPKGPWAVYGTSRLLIEMNGFEQIKDEFKSTKDEVEAFKSFCNSIQGLTEDELKKRNEGLNPDLLGEVIKYVKCPQLLIGSEKLNDVQEEFIKYVQLAFAECILVIYKKMFNEDPSGPPAAKGGKILYKSRYYMLRGSGKKGDKHHILTKHEGKVSLSRIIKWQLRNSKQKNVSSSQTPQSRHHSTKTSNKQHLRRR